MSITRQAVSAFWIFLPCAVQALCPIPQGPGLLNIGPVYCPRDGDCHLALFASTDKAGKCTVTANFSEICITAIHHAHQKIVFDLRAEDSHHYKFDDPLAPNVRPHPHHHGAEPNKQHDHDTSDLVDGKIGGGGLLYTWTDLNKTTSTDGMGLDFFVYGDASSDVCEAHDPVVFNTGH